MYKKVLVYNKRCAGDLVEDEVLLIQKAKQPEGYPVLEDMDY